MLGYFCIHQNHCYESQFQDNKVIIFFEKVSAEQNLSHDPSLSLSHHNSGGDGRRISDLR